MSLARKVKILRTQHLAYTQWELAKELDLNPVAISRWERGVSDPSLRHIRRMAEVAGLPATWFFQEETEAVA